MKKISTLLIAGLMVLAFGCKKDISKNDPIDPENPVSWQQNISPDFDWNMWKDVNVLLTNTQNKIITVTTVDGEGQYAKMMGVKDSYQLTLKIPKITEQISINGNVVSIQNGAVVFALPADYKSVASAAWALDFDRNASDYINAGDPGIDAYPFTMEAWIKTTGYGSNMAIMGYCSSSNDEYQFGVYVDGTDGKLTIRSKKGLVSEEEKGSSVVTDNLWHHVAVVFASSTTSRLYVDGTLKATETAASPLLPTEVNVFTIGRWGDSNPDSYFDGIIDEVRLWKKERSEWQIKTYLTKSITNLDDLAGYWPMEEGSGTQTVNEIGNGMVNLTAPDWIGNIDTDGDGIYNINDNYPHDPLRAFNNYWPANAGTLAFEDLWPSMGDYDMNDAVIGYQFNNVTNSSNKLVESFCSFTLKANGASLNSGFGFSLPGNTVAEDKFQLTGHQLGQNFITLNENGSESGQNYLTFIARDKLPSKGNTKSGHYTGTYQFTLKLQIINGGDYGVNAFNLQTWNPFIIVYHDSYLNKRGHEIHLAGYAPSNKVATILFDSVNDGSEYPIAGGGNLWYKTNVKASASGDLVGKYFPWGLDIPGNFSWTIEADGVHDPANGFYRPTIWYGYTKFKEWAGSNGVDALDWYSNLSYRDPDFIYSH